MEILKMKRKIYSFKTLEKGLKKRKLDVSPFIQVKRGRAAKRERKNINKNNQISTAVRMFPACYY